MVDLPLPPTGRVDTDAEEREEDRFERLIAACTIITTLIAGIVGFAQAHAIRSAEQAGARTQQLAIESFGQRVRAERAANIQYDRFILAQTQRRRAASAREERLFGEGDARRLGIEERIWQRVAANTDRRSRAIARAQASAYIAANGATGPRRDPQFPSRFFAQLEREPARAAALREAASALSSTSEARSTAFALTLTMFAIAVFLFGFTLTGPGERHPRIYAGTAAAFVLAATAYAALVALRPGEGSSAQAAADAYADGVVALALDRPAQAIAPLSRAIQLRPGFARAYVERANAIVAASSPELSPLPSLATPRDLRRAIADNERAIELGVEDPSVISGLGFLLYRLSTLERDEDVLEDAIELSRRAIRASPGDPLPAFNLGVSLLAAGREREARAAYREGVRKTLYIDPRRKVLRDNPEDYVGGALTVLATLPPSAARRHAAAIRHLKEYIVGTVAAAGEPAGKAPVAVDEVRATLDPGHAELAVRSQPALRLDRDVLSAQWFYRYPRGLGWAALPQISGRLREEEVARGEGGTIVQRVSYLAATTRCLPPGSYKVELYLNGRFLREVPAEGRFAALEGARDRDLGVSLCKPEDWRAPARANLPGLVASWSSDDDTRGALAFRLERGPGGPDSDVEATSLDVMDQVMSRFAHLFPGPPVRGAVRRGSAVMGLTGEVSAAYSYESAGGRGEVSVVAGYDFEGRALVGAVFGPRRAMVTTGRDVFLSMSPD